MTVDALHLVKQYGRRTALDVPHLHLDAATTFGLVGSNGAGKTTFLRLLLGLLRPDRGGVRIGGHVVTDTDAWKRACGSYLDESFLLPYLTPDEYLAFVGGLYGLSARAVRAALQPFETFYTDEPLGKTTKLIRSLSLGNRKKVGMIAAMFVRPRLLVLDEPFANLDPGSQIRLKLLLRQLSETHGTTLILSSHDLGHVTDVCRRIALLEHGRLVRDEETSEATLGALQQYFAAMLE